MQKEFLMEKKSLALDMAFRPVSEYTCFQDCLQNFQILQLILRFYVYMFDIN